MSVVVPDIVALVCVSGFAISGFTIFLIPPFSEVVLVVGVLLGADVSDGGEVCCVDVSPPIASNEDDEELESEAVSGVLVVVVSGACWGVVKVSENVSKSDVDDSPKGPSLSGTGGIVVVIVPLAPRGWKRFISLFRNLGLSNSSRFWAGTAAPKQIAGSNVDSKASEAANITVDLRIIVDVVLLFTRGSYYDIWVVREYVTPGAILSERPLGARA